MSNKLSTYEDFKNFIGKNSIKSRKDFYRRFNNKYNEFRKLSKEQKDTLLPKKVEKTLYSIPKTVKEFIEFCKSNNITKRTELALKYQAVYKKFRNLSKKEQDQILSLKIEPYLSVFETLEDFQNYIDQSCIETYKDFRKLHKSIYERYLSLRKNWTSSELKFKKDLIVSKHRDLNTLEDFQKFIDDNNIQTKTELREKYKSVSSRFFKIIPKEERCNLKFPKELHHYFYNELSTLEDFQKFINDNRILRPIDFKSRFPKEYDRFCRIIPQDDKSRIIYKIDDPDYYGSRRSYGERYLRKLFTETGFNFIQEKTFPDLTGKYSYLRYDFYLNDLNILVEYHGEQHFNKNSAFYSDLIDINDRKKYEYSKKNGIPILYFTLHSSAYKKYGYFTEVLTDVNTLLERIKEIGMTNQSNK